MLDHGKFKEVGEKIEKLLNSTKITEKESIKLKISKVHVYLSLRDIKKGFSLVEKLIKEINTDKYYEEFIKALIAKRCALNALSKYHEALDVIEVAINFFEKLSKEKKLKLELLEGKLLLQKGWCYYQLGKYKETEIYAKEALKIFDKLGDSYSIAGAFCALGMVQRNVNKSIEFLEESIAIYNDLNNNFRNIEVYHYISRKYNRKGEPFKALEYMNKTLPVIYSFNDDYKVSVTLLHLVPILIEIGDYEKARKNALEALELLDKQGFIAVVGNMHYYLARIALYQGDIKEAIKRKDILFNLRTKYQNPTYYVFQYQILDALILKESKDQVDIDKAEEILRDLRGNGKLPWVYRFEIIYYLCEILLHQYQKTNNPDILDEIDLLSQEVVDFGNKLESSRLKINGYNIRLLTLFVRNLDNEKSIDITEVKTLINNLYNISEKSGLKTSLDRFVLQYVELMNKSQFWMDFIQK